MALFDSDRRIKATKATEATSLGVHHPFTLGKSVVRFLLRGRQACTYFYLLLLGSLSASLAAFISLVFPSSGT